MLEFPLTRYKNKNNNDGGGSGGGEGQGQGEDEDEGEGDGDNDGDGDGDDDDEFVVDYTCISVFLIGYESKTKKQSKKDWYCKLMAQGTTNFLYHSGVDLTCLDIMQNSLTKSFNVNSSDYYWNDLFKYC